MPSEGFIKLDRKLLKWRFSQQPSAVTLWVHLLLLANWQNGYYRGREIPRGSLATSVKSLSQITGLAEKTVRRWIQKFEDNGEIRAESTNRFTIITVLKYDDFQNSTGTEVTNQMTNQVTNQMTNQVTNQVTNDRRNKEYKEVKEEKKERNYSSLDDRLAKRRAEGKAMAEPVPPSLPSPPPSLEDVKEEVEKRGFSVSPYLYWNYREAHGWLDNWKNDLAVWEEREKIKNKGNNMAPKKTEADGTPSKPEPFVDEDPEVRAALLRSLRGEI